MEAQLELPDPNISLTFLSGQSGGAVLPISSKLAWACSHHGLRVETINKRVQLPLVTIVKLWEKPRCPTTDKWIKKV
jgi:hypothetical protein